MILPFKLKEIFSESYLALLQPTEHKKMEKIQEKALKCIYEDQNSTYEELLEKSKLPSLKVRRIRTIAIETFKIMKPFYRCLQYEY
jgi:CRISPR/Cas system-associated endoribonuclease Cas2